MNSQSIADKLKKYIDDKLPETRGVILSELEKKTDTLEEMVDTLKTENVKLRESIDHHDDHFMNVQTHLVEQEQ